MEQSTKRVAIVGGVIAVGFLLFMMNRRDNFVAAGGAIPDSPFITPYFTDGKMPSEGFNSVVNLNVNTAGLSGLANQYFPTFGFVAVGVTGNLPRSITNVTVLQNTAPPQQVVQQSQVVPPKPVWSSTGSRSGTPDGYYDLTGASPRGLTSNLPRSGGSSGF